MKKKKVKKFWELVNYFALIGLIIGQVTIGFFFYVGQITFLTTDIDKPAEILSIVAPSF